MRDEARHSLSRNFPANISPLDYCFSEIADLN